MVVASRQRRLAAGVVALIVLPAAAVAGLVLSRAPADRVTVVASDTPPYLYGTTGLDEATIDALLRGWASDLFASFEWANGRVRGSYLEFGYDAASATFMDVTAKGPETRVLLLSSIRVEGFLPTTLPLTYGPRFEAYATNLTIAARDDPMSSLEFRTNGTERIVTFALPPDVTEVASHWAPDAWPASSFTFSMGETRALLVLGFGAFEVSGMHVTARMRTTDLLVFKAIPAFSAHRSERSAFLDAIASGRLAATLAVISMTNGRWLEIRDLYRLALTSDAVNVSVRHAYVRINGTNEGGAVVLLAFDPKTMPTDPLSRLLVRANGEALEETNDTLGTFYASSAGWARPFYARLPLGATVLAVYLPSLASTTIEVESIALPAPPTGMDAATQGAMVVALGIVSLAAAHMFRSKRK